MALKNAKRDLTVMTALGDEPDPDKDDPVVLAHVSGAEGISMSYAFDLTLIGGPKTEVDGSVVVGNRASFGIRNNKTVNGEQEEGHVERFGILQNFEKVGTANDRRIFRARLVPAFHMTTYEQRYRVFEDKTLAEILKEVLAPFPLVDLRDNLVSDVKHKVIPFCVQYNETTFAFVHRLLERCGISYRYEHDADLRRERMVLSDTVHNPKLVDFPMRVTNGEGAAVDSIVGFKRSFVASAQNARVADFNEIDPQRTPEGLAIIDKAYAMDADSVGIRAESFPASGLDPADPDALAKLRMRKNEAAIASGSGRTRSTGFFAGRVVPIGKDDTGSGADGISWVLRLVTIEAFHAVDDRSVFDKAWDFLKAAAGLGSGRGKDDLVGQAAEQLRDQLKEDVAKGVEIYNWLDKKADATDPSGLPGFIADKIGRAGTGLFSIASLAMAAAPGIKDAIEKLFEDSSNVAFAFEAFPISGPSGPDQQSEPYKPDRWPTPNATRPMAPGPHLALVLGPKGVDTSENDIFTDALGRVRIRLPWDPGPPGKDEDTPAEGPFANDKNTCWVRVSDGWAGERYGVQFLPRIGQEVVVGFLDGDPEKPMVIGRAYNAHSGNSHLPFPNLSAGKASISKKEDLPATANSATTRSGIRTKSMPAKGATDVGFHMIRFEDEKGKEQFLLRAERRLDTTSTGSRYDTTRGNHHVVVGGGKKSEDQESGGGMFVGIGGEKDQTIGDSRYEKIKTDLNLTVEGQHVTEAKSGYYVDGGPILTLTADTIALQAKKKIQLVVGNSKLVVTPAAIFTDAAMIPDKAGAPADNADGPDIAEPLGAAEADPGDPPDWLAQQAAKPHGKGGGRKKKALTPRQAIRVSRHPEEPNIFVVGGENGGQGIMVDAGDTGDAAFVSGIASDLQDMRDNPATAKAVQDAENRKNAVVISKPEENDHFLPPFSRPLAPDDSVPEGSTPEATGTGSPSQVVAEPTGPEDADKEEKQKKLAKALQDSQPDDTGTNDPKTLGSDRVPEADPPPGEFAPPKDISDLPPPPPPVPGSS